MIQASELKKEFYDELKYDKIKINWNKNPIEMNLFLSFLTAEVVRSHDHLGSSNGWTLLKNDGLNLKISGGVVNGTEYLDSLQFGTKLNNPYNNFVSPFYLFEILSKEGKQFFVDYYKQDIDDIISKTKDSIAFLKQSLVKKEALLNKLLLEVEALTTI